MTAQPRSFRPLLGVLALLLAAVLYLALYARAATLDVAYADYLLPPFITAVDACMSGQDCLGALVAPTSNGYRWTVPAFLLSVNAMVFGLTTRFELVLGFAGLILASLTLYFWLSTTWLRTARPIVSVVAWVPCLFFLFNLNQWENIVLGIGGYHLLGLAALFACLWVFDRSLSNPVLAPRHAISLFLTLVFSSFFLLQYFAVLAVALACVTAFALVVRRSNARGLTLTMLAGLATGLLLAFVPGASPGRSTAAILPAVEDLTSVARFMLNMVAAAMLQWEGKRAVAESGYMLGLPALIAMVMSIWLFVSQKMYRTSWLPLALCVYSVLACVVVSFSRYRYGVDYGFASRYSSQTILGLIGCYLILVKALERPTHERGAIGLVAVFCLTAAVLQLATHVVQWHIAPHRQAYYREVARVASSYEQASDADLALFQIPLESTRQALPVLRRHRLAFFR